MVARPWSSSRLSCGERLLLRCDGNSGNSFPTTQGNDTSSQARKRKRGSSGWGWDYRASSRVETGMLGIFLSCSKCVKDLWNFQILGVISLETPQRKWASSRVEGRTSWIFSTWGRCSRLMMGTTGTRSGGFRKGQSPCDLFGGLSGFLSRRCRGLRPCVESVPEPEDSSPVLTWILGNFWSLPWESVLVSSGGMHVRFPPECSRSVTLPFAWIKGSVAFPRGFPTRLSHEAFPQGCPRCPLHVSRSPA